MASNAASSRPAKKQRLDGDGNSVATPIDLTAPRKPPLDKGSSRIFKNAIAASTLQTTSVTSTKKPAATFNSTEDFIAFAPEPVVEQREPDRPNRPNRKRTSEHLDQPVASSSKRRAEGNRSTPWTWDIDWFRYHDVPSLFHAEVRAFSDFMSPTEEEHECRRLIIQLIERAVTSRWPDASVLPFGSFETKLYHPLGDIDLVIQSRRMETANRKSVLFQLSDLLRREGITDTVQVIAKARVPIIKFITTYGRFAVDISINQENGLAAGCIVNNFLYEIPALRPLAMVVKAFLRERKANEVFNGGLGSYSTVCMLVSFLQMHPKVRSGEIRPERNLGTLLIEFFELFGHLFNSREVGISLRNGGSYFSKSSRGWLDARSPLLLSIEDPQDASNDVSRGSFNIHNVLRHFAGANEMLTSVAYQRAATMDSMRRGHHVRLGAATPDMSLLSSLMTVDTETLEHRSAVRDLYDSGMLHDWLGVPKRALVPRPPSATPPALPPQSPRRDVARLRALPAHGESEAEMEVSEEEGQLRSEPDSEMDTRYRRRPLVDRITTAKPSAYEAYDTTSEEEVDMDAANDFVLNTKKQPNSEDTSESDDGSHHATKPALSRTDSGRPVKIDRKRNYWAAKAGS